MTFEQTIVVDTWYDQTAGVKITGKVWIFGDWSAEHTITIEVKNSNEPPQLLGGPSEVDDEDNIISDAHLTFVGGTDNGGSDSRVSYQAIQKCGVLERIDGRP